MLTLFYLTAFVAIGTTCMVVLSRQIVHALVYLVVSFLSVAMLFFLLGAPLAAALEVIVYAGAIMMLFVFVMMMLKVSQEPLPPRSWVWPCICTAVLLAELLYALRTTDATFATAVDPQEVSLSLFGPYALGVEMVAFLLLAGLMGAYHLAKEEETE